MSKIGCLFQNIILIISGRLDRSCAIFHVKEGHTVTTAFAKYVLLRGKGVKEIQKGFSPGDTHTTYVICVCMPQGTNQSFFAAENECA